MAKGRGRLSNLLSKQIVFDKANKQQKHKDANKELHYSKNAKKLQNKIRKENAVDEPYNESKVFIPFATNDRVLVIGDGDFSYSVCIIKKKLMRGKNLISTSYDSLSELHEKYGVELIDGNLQVLKDAGVIVHHGIDATKLSDSLGMSLGNKRIGSGAGKSIAALGGLRINNIVFNFPHLGNSVKNVERNVILHQKFMFKFFKSCEEFYNTLDKQKEWTKYKEPVSDVEDDDAAMGLDEGTFFKELVNKKKSDVEDNNVVTVTLFGGEPYESWKVKKIAKDSIAYCVQRSGKFEWQFFDGYQHKRTAGLGETNKVSRTRFAKIYKFEKFELTEKQKIAKDKKKKRLGMYESDSDSD